MVDERAKSKDAQRYASLTLRAVGRAITERSPNSDDQWAQPCEFFATLSARCVVQMATGTRHVDALSWDSDIFR